MNGWENQDVRDVIRYLGTGIESIRAILAENEILPEFPSEFSMNTFKLFKMIHGHFRNERKRRMNVLPLIIACMYVTSRDTHLNHLSIDFFAEILNRYKGTKSKSMKPDLHSIRMCVNEICRLLKIDGRNTVGGYIQSVREKLNIDETTMESVVQFQHAIDRLRIVRRSISPHTIAGTAVWLAVLHVGKEKLFTQQSIATAMGRKEPRAIRDLIRAIRNENDIPSHARGFALSQALLTCSLCSLHSPQSETQKHSAF